MIIPLLRSPHFKVLAVFFNATASRGKPGRSNTRFKRNTSRPFKHQPRDIIHHMKNNNKKGFTLVEIMIVVVIIGLLAAMAIPAFQKVRTNSQDKTILNNLRQLNAAAQQYFLEQGVTSVTSTNLVGTDTDKYIKSIQQVADEVYPSPINATDTQIATTTRVVVFAQ